MMKVPPLVINLKNIEKQQHKEHKKHKKHKKHKRHHHKHNHQQEKHVTLNINQSQPPNLEPVELPEIEEPLPYYPSFKFPIEPNPIADPKTSDETVPTTATTNAENSTTITSVETPGVIATTTITTTTTTTPPATTTDQNELDKKQESNADDEPAAQPSSTSSSISAAKPEIQEPEQNHPMEVDQAEPQNILNSESKSENEPVADQMETIDDAPAHDISKSKANLSYLKLAEDGIVRLKIITSLPSQPDDTNERVLNLEQLCGELNEGIDVLPTEIDEEECKETLHVKPVEGIEPSAFGSYLPAQDSTFANLTKEESETLLEVYGNNDTCYQYAKSLQNYAKGTNYLMTMVDSLLDLLTDGKHGIEVVPIRKKQEAQDTPQAAPETIANGHGEDATEKVKEQEEDSKQEDSGQKDEKNDLCENGDVDKKSVDEVQADLDSIDVLLARLKEVQEKRLSSSAAPVEPGEEESQLADEILSKMTKLIKEKAKPQDIIDSKSVFKALGIEMNNCASN